MGPPAPPRLRAWTRWLLILGCMAGWSGSWSAALRPAGRSELAAAGQPQGEQRPSHAGRRRPSPPVSVYRTPALLRGGHGKSRLQRRPTTFTAQTSSIRVIDPPGSLEPGGCCQWDASEA